MVPSNHSLLSLVVVSLKHMLKSQGLLASAVGKVFFFMHLSFEGVVLPCTLGVRKVSWLVLPSFFVDVIDSLSRVRLSILSLLPQWRLAILEHR